MNRISVLALVLICVLLNSCGGAELETYYGEIPFEYDTPTGMVDTSQVLMASKITTNKELLAQELKQDSVEATISYTLEYLEANIQYVFYWYPQGIEHTMATRNGDCTDKAQLMVELLRLNGVKARTAHGYNEWGKHDFVEVWHKGDWMIVDYSPELRRVGIGIW